MLVPVTMPVPVPVPVLVPASPPPFLSEKCEATAAGQEATTPVTSAAPPSRQTTRSSVPSTPAATSKRMRSRLRAGCMPLSNMAGRWIWVEGVRLRGDA